jgi:hypothetical protein
MSKPLVAFTVMIADANRISSRTLQRQLATKPNVAKVEIFDRLETARKALGDGEFNCLFVDIFSLGIDTGIELIQLIQAKSPEAPICLYSESSDLITMPDVSEFWRKKFGHFAKLGKDQIAQGMGAELDTLLRSLASHLIKTPSRKKTGELVAAPTGRPPTAKTGGLRATERPPATKTGGLSGSVPRSASGKTGGLPPVTAERPPAAKTGSLRRGATGKLATESGSAAKSTPSTPPATYLSSQAMLTCEEYGLEITTPRSGTKIVVGCEVAGTYRYLPAGQHLWIVTVVEHLIPNPLTGEKLVAKQYWPQREVTTRDGAQWQARLEAAGGGPGSSKTLLVCAVGRNGQVLFDYFRQATRETQVLFEKLKSKEPGASYFENPAPLLELTDDVVECASILIVI